MSSFFLTRLHSTKRDNIINKFHLNKNINSSANRRLFIGKKRARKRCKDPESSETPEITQKMHRYVDSPGERSHSFCPTLRESRPKKTLRKAPFQRPNVGSDVGVNISQQNPGLYLPKQTKDSPIHPERTFLKYK